MPGPVSFRSFRRIIAVALVAALSSVGWYTPVVADSNTAVAREIVVKLHPATDASISAINAAYGTTTLKVLTPGSGVYLLDVPRSYAVSTVMQRLATDTRVLYSERNVRMVPPEGSPSAIGGWGGTDAAPMASQYATQAVELAQAHAITRGAGAVVAVIDTGVQADHPHLAASITSTGFDFVDGDAVPDDAFNQRDDDGDGLVDELAGHGTHVAGIVHLVAPEAQILPVRVLDSDGQGDLFTVAEAIHYAADHGADVINLSLGTPSRSRLLEDRVKAVSKRGVLVVAAVGNHNTRAEQYPAADQCAVGVTAVDAGSVKAAFANYGKQVTVAAPGDAIFSTFPRSGYAWWSGTSMATPFVAGQAALVRSVQPTLSVRKVAQVIAHTARSIDAVNPSLKGDLGFGAIAVGTSVERVAAGTVSNAGSSILSGGCDP